MERWCPTVVVCLNDRSGAVSGHLLAMSPPRGVRTVLSPVEAIGEGASSYYQQRAVLGFTVSSLSWAELACAKLLSWLGYKIFAGTPRVYWQYPSVMLAQALFGAASHNPWVRGGNRNIETFAVAARHYQDLIAAAGVPPSRIVVTGYPRHDEVWRAMQQVEELRERLWRHHDIPKDKYVITIGLPFLAQYYYASMDTLKADLHFALATIRRLFPDACLLLCRHPRTHESLIADLVGERTVLLDGFSTYEAIALADIYVTSFSSTSFAALAAGKCVLSFEFYDAPVYPLVFGWIQEALHAYSRDEFVQQVQRLADPSFRVRQLEVTTKGSIAYGLLDGECCRRFAEVILGHGEKAR